MSGFDYKEFLHILIGVPPEFKIGEITSVTHEVMCFAGSSLEQVTSPDDDVKVFDVRGKDVTKYAWWANPGKYTIKIISYSLCPSIGSDKAPSSLSYVATPLPPENILTYDYDTLKAALNDGRPLLLSAENKTFSARSEPHAVSVVNLRLTNLNAPSGIETDPELFQKHAPAGISTFQFSADNAPTGIISNELLGQNSSPTGIQEYEGLTNVHSPTGLIAYTASSVQPHNAKVFNLDFSRHPNALPTTADVIDLELKVGPQAISATPSLKIDSAPVGLSSVVSPSSLSSVNGLGTLVDMDEDGYYVGVDTDDNDPSITIHLQAQHAPTSIETKTRPAALTNLSHLVDMDEDGYYSDVDVDDNDDTRWDPPLIPTKIYIFPEVKSGSGWSAQSGGAGTHLNSLYNQYNFTHFKSTGTLCESGLFAGGVSCTRVYNTKSPWAPTIPGTYHLGGVYDLATSDTDPYPYYVRSLMLNLTDGSYVADTNVSKPKIEIASGPSGADNWKMSWDNRPESDFNFGGLINYAYINNDSWFMSKNGSTSNADLGDRDLSNLVNGTFHYDTGLIRNYHAYRIAYAYKI
jgi:hypothetical protein